MSAPVVGPPGVLFRFGDVLWRFCLSVCHLIGASEAPLAAFVTGNFLASAESEYHAFAGSGQSHSAGLAKCLFHFSSLLILIPTIKPIDSGPETSSNLEQSIPLTSELKSEAAGGRKLCTLHFGHL